MISSSGEGCQVKYNKEKDSGWMIWDNDLFSVFKAGCEGGSIFKSKNVLSNLYGSSAGRPHKVGES